MKFKQYINEARYKLTNKEIKKFRSYLAKREGIKPQHLEFIGAEDYRDSGLDYVLLHFNIEDPKHPRYKSTIGFKFTPKGVK